MSARLRDEDGSTLPLTIFYAVLCLALILLVVAATSLYLEHKRLFTLADGAALAAAEAFSLDQVSLDQSAPSDVVPRVSLDSADVRQAAQEYLADNPIGRFDRLRLEEADSADGESATVRISATWHPPVLSLFVPDGIHVDATSVARSVFW